MRLKYFLVSFPLGARLRAGPDVTGCYVRVSSEERDHVTSGVKPAGDDVVMTSVQGSI